MRDDHQVKAGQAYFLTGDSHPLNSHVEQVVHARLAPIFSTWTGQADILAQTGEAHVRPDIAERAAALERILPRGEETHQVVLIGRSSGSRVATCLAAQHNFAAVICLGYPFRLPGHALEPERFAHLAHLTVPTLIIQGAEDPYGGHDLTEHYRLSPSITLHFIHATHEMKLLPAEWDDVACIIAAFWASVFQGGTIAPLAFDEAFYLHANPDVATAIAAHAFTSGAQHYREHGRREGRSFRLLIPRDGDR